VRTGGYSGANTAEGVAITEGNFNMAIGFDTLKDPNVICSRPFLTRPQLMQPHAL